MNRIIIIGCGGHGRSIADTILDNDERAELVFLDKNAKKNEKILGFSVFEEKPSGIVMEPNSVILGIGDLTARRAQLSRMRSDWDEDRWKSIISNRAFIGRGVQIGKGVFIAKAAFVGVEAAVGDHSIINTGAIVEHEVSIGNNVHVAPGAVICGRCKVGNHVLVGAGSTIIDKLSICDDVIIGAGSVVVQSISESGTYAGNPARKVR